jgi:choline transport protein
MKEDRSVSAMTEEIDTVITKDGTFVSSDDALLMSMGKKPELKRVYNFWTCTLNQVCAETLPMTDHFRLVCAYQIMISCSWSCLVVLYSTIFDIGGPFALVWGTSVTPGPNYLR